MDFLEKNIKGILVGLLGLVVVGSGVALTLYFKSKNEMKAQNTFSSLEAEFKRYREQNDTPLMPNQPPPAVTTPVNKDQLIEKLKTFATAQKGSVAAQMAALQLVYLLEKDQKELEAISLLESLKNKSEQVSNVLLTYKIAQIYSNSNKCDQAIPLLTALNANKKLNYIHNEATLLLASCYRASNDTAKAEEVLNQLKNTKAEGFSDSNYEVDQLLKIIQFNKNLGS